MSNIPSSQAYIQTEATQFRRPVSENLLQTIGGATNFLNDLTTAHSGTLATHTANISTLFSDTGRLGPDSLQTQITNGFSTESAARIAGDAALQSQLNIKTNIQHYNIIPSYLLGIPTGAVSAGTHDVGATWGTISIGSSRFAIIRVDMYFVSCNALTIAMPSGENLLNGATLSFPTIVKDGSGANASGLPFSLGCTFILDSSSVSTSSLTFSGTFTNGRIHVIGTFHDALSQQVVVG